MEIIIIAAMSKNRVIGKGRDIPWKLPEDQQRFKKITMGHTLIMGRKTYESIGKPLPGRKTIIITRDKEYVAGDCRICHSLAEALKSAENDERVFIAGGGEIYAQTLGLADTIILTVIDREIAGDVFFPDFSTDDFVEIKREDYSGPPSFSIYIYERILPCLQKYI